MVFHPTTIFMSTILSNTSLPLYVWIIIIVVGSVVILGTTAFSIRLFVTHRRRTNFVDTFGDENLPQRKVTVRRGRVVEQSKYLSLTGSKFGLNAFGSEDDAQSRAGARSKSPFEWWSTVKDHPQSRSSMSINETSSVYGPTSPNMQRVYQRRDFNSSNTSLVSSTKENDILVSIEEQEVSAPLVRNFSRSFPRHAQHSPSFPKMQTLYPIKESSPHTSMISTRQSRGASYAGRNRDVRTDVQSASPQSLSQMSHSRHQLQEQEDQISSKKSSIYHESQEHSAEAVQAPLPVAYNGSRSSLGDPEPRRLSRGSARNSIVGSTKSRQQSQITALPEAPSPKQTNDYWEGRSDLHPVRTTSRKGRVLRKKSLKKAQMVAQIDS